MKKGRARWPAPDSRYRSESGGKYRHDLKRPRIHHHDLVANQEELVAAPIRIDRHDFLRKRMEADLAGNSGTDRNREVHVVDRGHMLVPDHGRDSRALLGGEPCASAGLSGGRGAVLHPPAFRRTLAVTALAVFGLHTIAAFTAFSLHAATIFAAFSLHAIAAFTTFSLHVLAFAALGLHVLARSALLVLGALG